WCRTSGATPRACSGRPTAWWTGRTAPASWTRARAFCDMTRRSVPSSRPRRRPERVAELIRQTVAAFLTANVRDPRVGFVTVTAVEVSRDLAHARIRVSVMGTDAEKAQTLEGLASVARFLRADWAKSYEGVIRLGRTTATDDATGPTAGASDAWQSLDRARVEAAVAQFRGAYEQRPPAYSAVKVAGERAYRRARRGEPVALPA